MSTKIRKRAGTIGVFLKKHYGIRMKDVFGKFRTVLLDDMEIVSCNLCGSENHSTVAERDKYNLPVTTVLCRNCGLLYLCPRPTLKSYAQFYEKGGSRDSRYHRKIDWNSIDDILKFYFGNDFQPVHTSDDITKFISSVNNKKVSKSQNNKFNQYGMDIYNYLLDNIPKGSKVFEVGASRGQLLIPWRELHGCEIGGVEPKKKSVELAFKRDKVKLFQGFSDHMDIPKSYYDLVMNVRTINHMLDPLNELRLSRKWLKKGGYLFVDIQDSIERSGIGGFSNSVVEIDHPYMFTMETLRALIEKAGFEIIRAEKVIPYQRKVSKKKHSEGYKRPTQIRILAKKTSEKADISYPDALWQALRLVKRLEDNICTKKKNNTSVQKQSRRVQEKFLKKKNKNVGSQKNMFSGKSKRLSVRIKQNRIGSKVFGIIKKAR